MWSDNESDIDLLQYGYLAKAVTRIVTNRELTPSTVGVFGDWGSGKSTLLKMVERQLASRDGLLYLTFNGWLFEGYDDAKSALMGAILDRIEEEIKKQQTPPAKALGLLKKLTARVNWLHLVALGGKVALPLVVGAHDPAAGMAVAGAAAAIPTGSPRSSAEMSAEDLEKIAKQAPEGAENIRRNIRDFRRDFQDLLTEAKITSLVVFIDDLDRCLPDTIIETLEAIKLFLFVEGSAFIIAADPHIVEYAVRVRFPELPGEEAQVGRDYLEKLIQFPLRVPPLSAAEIESYMNLLFAKNRLPGADFHTACERIEDFHASDITDHAFDLDVCRQILKGRPVPVVLEEDFDLVMQIAPVLTRGLTGSPRRTKRFLNTLLLRLELAEDRGLKLDRPKLAKLMLLEYFRDGFFRDLSNQQASQSGRPAELAVAEEHLRKRGEDAAPVNDLEDTKNEARGARKSARPVAEVSNAPLPAEVQTWLGDPWMEEWLRSDPQLHDTDLRPYFYISREKAGDLDSPLRLSPHGAEVLRRLLDVGKVSQNIGLNAAANVTEADATAIFQHLSHRMRRAQVLDDSSPQAVLLQLMQKKPELLPQLVALYAGLPETKITISTPALFWQTIKGTQSQDAGLLVLKQWSTANRTALANAVKEVLKRAAK